MILTKTGWAVAVGLSLILWVPILTCGRAALANGDYVESSSPKQEQAQGQEQTTSVNVVSGGSSSAGSLFPIVFGRPGSGGGNSPDGCLVGASAASLTGGGSIQRMDTQCAFRVYINTELSLPCNEFCGDKNPRVEAAREAMFKDIMSRTSWFSRFLNHIPILRSL